MGLFSKKEERFVGIDIGAGGVKAVELLNEGGMYKLMTYGYTQRVDDKVETPITDKPEDAARHVKRLIVDAGIESKTVVASLPVYAVFSSIIAIPKVKAEEETRVLVERQAAKLMPIPLEEMVLDYQFVDGKTENKMRNKPSTLSESDRIATAGSADENVRVLITGARKNMVQTYTKIFQDSGLDLASLETEPFALVRSLVGRERNPVMLLDIGSYRTNMTIVEEGVPFLNRSIKVGGSMVTRAMANQLGVTATDAEQMKYDLAANQNGETPKAVVDLFQPIVNEIAYAMKLYADSDVTDHRRVEKVILTGGSAHLPGLDRYLTEKLNVRTFVGDPWSRVQVNEAMRPVLDDVGPRFSVAIGLAMHAKKAAVKETPKKEKLEREVK
jgi:type IV pilus assembly protein PilM